MRRPPRAEYLIHRSAWKGNSQKLNFRFTEFSEVHLCGILRRFSMTTRNTSTAGLIWGSLWRASLYGMLLGAGLGGLYGASLGTLLYTFFGIPFGLFFGAIAGATAGLLLGVFDGLVLGALLRVIEDRRGSYNDTPVHRAPQRPDPVHGRGHPLPHPREDGRGSPPGRPFPPVSARRARPGVPRGRRQGGCALAQGEDALLDRGCPW